MDMSNTLLSTMRNINKISYKVEKTTPWESKIGGVPYLEQISDYPLDDENKPYLFLVQLNLSDIKNMPELPQKGLLQFYIKNDDELGYSSCCVVKYIENYITEEDKLLNEHPYKDDYFNYPFTKDGKLFFETDEMYVDSSCNEFLELGQFSKDEEDALYCYRNESRIGGYPMFMQYDTREDEKYDFLLLQINSDSICGIEFGDGGVAKFFINKNELLAKNFSDVFYTWDC